MTFLRFMGSFLKNLLQFVQFLAQLGKRPFCWIGFLICLLGGAEVGFHRSVFLVPAAIFGSVHSMCAPMFLAQLAGPLKMDFLGNLLHGSSTGLLSSCLILVLRSFLAGLRICFLGGNTCSIAYSKARRECMPMGVIPFSCRLY